LSAQRAAVAGRAPGLLPALARGKLCELHCYIIGS